MNKPTFKEICLMYIQQLTNFPYIEKDFDALTDYGLLCKVVDKLNEVITNTNMQDEYIVNLYNAFTTLKEYVDNYFDNLDVQDEINNKLDEMVSDGTFDKIINQELFSNINENINNINTTLNNQLPPYKPLTMVQGLSVQFPKDTSVQGMCLDDNNNVYFYVMGSGNNGDLYKYNLFNHTYIAKIENIPLYHGNSLIYKNDKIYCAGLNGLEINVYNTSTGVTTNMNPFSSLTYNKVLCICDYDSDHIICGINEIANNSDLQYFHLYKLNINNMSYEEITLHWYTEIQPARVVDITFINNKFYILCDSPEYLIELLYDDDNLTLTQNKNYIIPRQNELGLDLGELEGIDFIKNNIYGNESFVFSSFIIGNDVGGLINYSIYISDLSTDLLEYTGDLNDNNILNKVVDIHVKKSGTNNIENGSSTYPFKDINRAIAFANNNKLNIDYIIIDDSETYDIGKQANKIISIKAKDNTVNPVIKISQLINCKVRFNGSTLKIGKSSDSATNFSINNTNLVIISSELNSYIYASVGSYLFLNNVKLNCDYSITNAFEFRCSNGNLYIGTITGTYKRLIGAYDGSIVSLNHSHNSEPTGVGAGSVITVTSA